MAQQGNSSLCPSSHHKDGCCSESRQTRALLLCCAMAMGIAYVCTYPPTMVPTYFRLELSNTVSPLNVTPATKQHTHTLFRTQTTKAYTCAYCTSRTEVSLFCENISSEGRLTHSYVASFTKALLPTHTQRAPFVLVHPRNALTQTLP